MNDFPQRPADAADAAHGHALGHAQLMLWAGQCLQPDEPLYNMAIVFRIAGELDTAAFASAFDALVAGTDSLRAVLAGDGEAPVQVFLGAAPAALEHVDLSHEPSPEQALAKWAQERCGRLLDLRRCSWDAALLRLGDCDHAWYLNQHHLYTDAWTKSVLFRRLSEHYGRVRAGRREQPGPAPQFLAHLQRLERNRDSPALAAARRYWQQKLSSPPAPSRFYRPTPAVRSGRTTRLTVELGEQRSARLRNLAATAPFRALTAELAQFRLFATVLFALLHRLGGQQDLALGAPALNRASLAEKQTAGLFIELFPLRVAVTGEESFVTLHHAVARESQALLLHARPGACSPEQGRAYDVVLNFITARFGRFDGLPVRSEWVHPGCGDRAHLLRLQVQDFDDRGTFTLLFDLAEDCFHGEEREWLTRHFLRLLDAFLDDPDRPVHDVALMDAAQRDAQLAALRGPQRPLPGATVLHLLREQARRTPDAVALCEGARASAPADDARPSGTTMSYAELEGAVSRVAAALAERGIGRGSVVAVALTRSVDAVIALLGVMRSGAAHVPLDPAHPRERLAYMLADCGACAIVTPPDGVPEGIGGEHATLTVDELRRPPDAAAPPGLPGSDALAYVLYTSGSTGRPKGVAVAHASLCSYVAWAARQYCAGEPLAFPLFTPLTFDLTVTSLLVPLTVGGTVVVYEEASGSRDITVRRVVEDDRVDVVKLTPAHLALLQDLDLSRSRLRVLVVGGEDFKTSLARSMHQRLGGRAAVYNEYGPTEGTVACMIHRYDPRRDTAPSVPIGRAIDNAEIYLLGAGEEPVPRGVVGEIAIGGAGVARGYLAELRAATQNTAARRGTGFVRNPFRAGERMYRSGDRGYLDEHGVVHYLGRADEQIKVRGVRVETAEVEAALLTHPDVKACAVGLLRPAQEGHAAFCVNCGLDARHPQAELDGNGVCRPCRGFASERSPARAYFGDSGELAGVVARIRAAAGRPPHCLMLLSGGKDSTYALCRLVEMGLVPLVFTLDNGYISDGAKANIRRVVDKLGLELVVGSTPAMRRIFRDSLARFSNVCNGCFKTIYTLAMKLAHERGIRHIVTGLSRGQIFETRLADLFDHGVTSPDSIDRTIVEARKAYHRMDDAVSRCLDVSLFEDDEIFDSIEFVDFYRHCDASLEQILDYLAREAPWIRPADTGRSTNCLINDVGIYVHKLERGYHNYSLPYSWDVRLGHKRRDAAREELDDRIDLARVQRILDEVGYRPNAGAFAAANEPRLAAWVVGERPLAAAALREWLASRVPAEFLPAAFIELDALPLTANGKVDRAALPRPERGERGEHGAATPYAAPSTAPERALAGIWAAVLGVPQVGVHDNFFDLGGDSILSLQIVSRARGAGIPIAPQQVFDHPTVASLAAAAGAAGRARAEQGAVQGSAPVTPTQRRFLEEHAGDLDRHAQVAALQLPGEHGETAVAAALAAAWQHHDALRTRFVRGADGRWQQRFGEVDEPPRVHPLARAGDDLTPGFAALRPHAETLRDAMDVGAGHLLQAALLPGGAGASSTLLLAVHPLAVDAVSWWILIEDLDTLLTNPATPLPSKSSSMKQWAESLARRAGRETTLTQADHWLRPGASGLPAAVVGAPDPGSGAGRDEVLLTLDAATTARLLHQAAPELRAQVPDLIAAALMEALHEQAGIGELDVTVEGHGRDSLDGELDLLRTVGALACAYPVRLAWPAAGGRVALLRAVKEQLRGLPGSDIDYGLLRYPPGESALAGRLAERGTPPLTLGYMGQWQPARGAASGVRFLEPPHRLGRPGAASAAVELDAVVFDARLELRFHYRPQACGRAWVESLAQGVRDALLGLVDDAASAATAALAPSDFPHADLAADELDDILSEFGDEQ